MTSKVLSVLLAVVLTLFTAEGCEKHDVPAGSDRGDSAGDNQPNKCAVPPDKAKINPIALAENYIYELWVSLENEDCETVGVTQPATIFREGTYRFQGQALKYVEWVDRSPTGNMIDTRLPWYSSATFPKTRHTMGVTAVIKISKVAFEDLNLAWLECAIERDGRYVTEQVNTRKRIPINGPGTYTISCAGDFPTG